MKYRPNRRLCNRPVKAYTDGRTITATLRNVSSFGARLDGIAAVPGGARIALHLFGEWRKASLIWSRNGTSGLKFDAPLTVDELIAIHRPFVALREPQAPRKSRPRPLRRFSELT